MLEWYSQHLIYNICCYISVVSCHLKNIAQNVQDESSKYPRSLSYIDTDMWEIRQKMYYNNLENIILYPGQ